MTNYQYTLLFVDDEKSILNSLHRTFRNDDYKILLANSGLEGLQVLKENDVSIIISDQRMPGMTGAQFLAQSKFEAPHAIRILLTGYSDIEDAMQSINEGQIFRYLNKPWDDIDLKHAVLQALVFHDLSRRNEAIADDLKNQNQNLRNQLTDLKLATPTANDSTEARHRLETENAQLRKALSQRDELLRTWQKHLDQVLGPIT